MEKLFFFDTETTGVNFWQHCIHQISGMVVIDNEIKERFNWRVRPHPAAKIEDDALKIANVTREQIAQYPEQIVVYKQLVCMLAKYVDKYNKNDKFFAVGYNNASFDNNFLRAFFKQNNDAYYGSWFWSAPIDVMVLAANELRSVRTELEDFKLMTVAKYLDIEIDESRLHDAEYDILLTYLIFNKINFI